MPTEPAADRRVAVEPAEETPFYIAARGALEQARRVLKHGDTFAVFDSSGDIGPLPTGEDGVFHCDTRHLSRFEFKLNGLQPLLLGSNVRDDNVVLTVDLPIPTSISTRGWRCRRTPSTSFAAFSFGTARRISVSGCVISASRASS